MNLKSYLNNNQFTSVKNPEHSTCVSKYYNLKDNLDNTLLFESRFECGNLQAASRVSESEYHLLLSYDTNTVGYAQWFFFRVSNVKKNRVVKFNIINMVNF